MTNKTKAYGLFKFKKNALPVNLEAASSMSKEEAQKPLKVTRNYIVLEGAERLIACQKLKIEVHYKFNK